MQDAEDLDRRASTKMVFLKRTTFENTQSRSDGTTKRMVLCKQHKKTQNVLCVKIAGNTDSNFTDARIPKLRPAALSYSPSG